MSQMKITIKDLAKAAGVSIATVSRAINGDKKVNNATLQKVLSIAKELDYKPNISARNLVRQNTKIIGLVLPDIQGDFYTEIVRGVDEIAYKGGYHVIVASSHSERNIFESIMNFMGQSMVDGVILMIPSLTNQLKEVVTNSNTPIILVNGKTELQNLDTVSIDNFQGSFSIVNFLINSYGYKKIALIKGPSSNNDAIERTEGYISALRENRIDIREEWMIGGDFTIEGGKIAASRLLSLIDKPDVIFASNDMMAVGCYSIISSLGQKIPDDIGVAGFDHTMLSNYVYPKLTTVHVPTAEIGKTAANILLNRILNKNQTAVQHIKISTGIIIGDSCRNILNN
ncbi:MAG: LacI family DNA-binding transcriptional regulator [bacterium]